LGLYITADLTVTTLYPANTMTTYSMSMNKNYLDFYYTNFSHEERREAMNGKVKNKDCKLKP